MSSETSRATPGDGTPRPAGSGGRTIVLGSLLVVTALATIVATFVLVTMFEHKQAARTPFVRLVEVDEVSTDPAPWGVNWPQQFEGYAATAGSDYYGGSSAMPASKLEKQPWLRRLYAGYAFSLDYREARGHAYMLHDQTATERVTERPQAGACLHCHASTTVMYRKVGLDALGLPSDGERLAEDFDMPAVVRGFEEVGRMPYHEALALLATMPDGTPGENQPLFPDLSRGGPEPAETPAAGAVRSEAHPVSCIDCHDPDTMAIRVTRPGFVLGMAALAESGEPVPHLPSVERWRKGPRSRRYDPNALASRQEMRSFVCGQCHVEYYCASKMVLTFPWGEGLRAEQLERFWEEQTFADGTPFFDWVHGETGAPAFKVQHPEFELWSQGIHARNGVSCADCHMPYERVGAMKVSSHDVRSPMESVDNSCQTCHRIPESEIRENVAVIQGRTVALTERAAQAMTDMLDAIREAQASGATSESLADVFVLQRKAMWRLDYVSSENSKGFHADQEAARILAESIDYSRRAQVAAVRLRAPAAPSTAPLPDEPVLGVTPTGEAPLDPGRRR